MHSTTKPLAASLLAKWFIARVGQDPEQDLSNLKLQKLVYLAHSRFLFENNRPLIREAVQAWDHGPVVAVLYRECSGFGDGPIHMELSSDGPWNQLGGEVNEVLENTWTEFGGYSALKLRDITHAIGPWRNVYLKGVKNLVIPNEDIGNAWSNFVKVSEAAVPPSNDLAQTLNYFKAVLDRAPAQHARGNAEFLLDELDSLEELRRDAASQLL